MEQARIQSKNMDVPIKRIPKLSEFHVSEVCGFMLEDPLEELPGYFSIWNYIGKNVDILVSEHRIRDEISKMPLLDASRLSGHREWRLAFMLLSFMGSGYIWQEGDKKMAKVVPNQLAIPWVVVSDYLHLPSIVCHTGCMLSNWALRNPQRPISLENLKGICRMPGGKQSEWFFLVTAQVELEGLPGLKAILGAMEGVVNKDLDKVKLQLEVLRKSLKATTVTFSRMLEGTDPDVFYNQIRPFLSGFGGRSSPLAPEGIIFEGVGDTKPRKFLGGSAAQSTMVQCFDAGLGILHGDDCQSFLALMRHYMLPAHAEFIEALWQGPSIRDYVATAGNNELTDSYNQALSALVDMRTYHIQIVTRYIVIPSSKLNRTKNYEGVAKRGTGGQALVPFLKLIRDTTRSHIIPL